MTETEKSIYNETFYKVFEQEFNGYNYSLAFEIADDAAWQSVNLSRM